MLDAKDAGCHRQLHEKSELRAARTITAVCLSLSSLLLGSQGCGGTSASTPPPAAPTFTTVDAPGAGTAAGLGTFVQDINADGDIAGYFTQTPLDLGHAFLRSAAGAVTVLDVPGQGTQSRQGATAQRINSGGTIVGYFADQQSIFHGYTRAMDGTFNIIDVPGASETYATGINDSGVVAGLFVDQNQARHGFVRAEDGTFTAFEVPGNSTLPGNLFSVIGINAIGAVIGFFTDDLGIYHGFLRNPDGTVVGVDVAGAGIDGNLGTVVADVNTSGVIAGTYQLSMGNVSFLRTPAGAYTFFNPPDVNINGSSPTGINDSGVIVGNYTDTNNSTHGYLRSPDGTLTVIDEPNAGQGPNSPGTFVTHINVKSAIVGYYFDTLGARHGFVRE